MENIAVLGCTGSIGTQALEVAALHPDRFRVKALTAHSNADKLFELVRLFKPDYAFFTGGDIPLPEDVGRICEWGFGKQGLIEAAVLPGVDTVLDAVMGMAGLEAVLAAGKAGKKVLLANKEALVAGGALVMGLFGPLKEHRLLPVDSEHSAIWQCLEGAHGAPPRELSRTASGGPFRTWDAERIRNANAAQALGHPTWSMGKKITVDSATMFNKALEIIEARWLFDVAHPQISVHIHPQSIVHSAVRFYDGTVIAQLGIPDMRLPILYAMSWPERLATGTADLDLFKVGTLTFEKPDDSRFPAMKMARACLDEGGTACAVLNAANEEAVSAFLRGKIPLGAIYDTVAYVLDKLPSAPLRELGDILEADQRARKEALDRIGGRI